SARRRMLRPCLEDSMVGGVGWRIPSHQDTTTRGWGGESPLTRTLPRGGGAASPLSLWERVRVRALSFPHSPCWTDIRGPSPRPSPLRGFRGGQFERARHDRPDAGANGRAN